MTQISQLLLKYRALNMELIRYKKKGLSSKTLVYVTEKAANIMEGYEMSVYINLGKDGEGSENGLAVD